MPQSSPHGRFAPKILPHGRFATKRMRHMNVTENLSVGLSVGQTFATVPMWKIRHIEVLPHNGETCEHDRKFKGKRPTNFRISADEENSPPERLVSKTNLSAIFIVLETTAALVN